MPSPNSALYDNSDTRTIRDEISELSAQMNGARD